MSPAKADAPLRKVTLNLYEADCAAMERHHGFGWTEQVRQLVHGHTSQFSRPAGNRRTLGDLADDNQ